MSLFRLPRGKFSLSFLAVPAGKDGRVECPRQAVDGFIGIRGSVCGLFLFVQTHAPLIVPPWQSRARKSKFHFYQAQGRGCFPPCTCGWWLVDGLQVPVVMRFLYRSAFLQTVPYELPTAFLDRDAILLHEPIGKIFKTRCAVQHRRNLFPQGSRLRSNKSPSGAFE